MVAGLMVMLTLSRVSYTKSLLTYMFLAIVSQSAIYYITGRVSCGNCSIVSFWLSDIIDYCISVCCSVVSIRQFSQNFKRPKYCRNSLLWLEQTIKDHLQYNLTWHKAVTCWWRGVKPVGEHVIFLVLVWCKDILM